MKKRTKIIVLIAVPLLCVLAVLFLNSDMWDFIQYTRGKYAPPMIEAALVEKIDVEEGELLSTEELNAFFDEWGDAEFSGYYGSMPENLRRLADSFVERVNTRYESRISTVGSMQIVPHQVRAVVSNSSIPGFVCFSFSSYNLDYAYYYNERECWIKQVNCPVPNKLEVFSAGTILSKLTEEKEKVESDVGKFEEYQLNFKSFTIAYTLEKVTLFIPSYYKEKESQTMGIFSGTEIKEIPTADYNEYMRDVKTPELRADNPKEKLSLRRIEKYIAAKRKAEAKAANG